MPIDTIKLSQTHGADSLLSAQDPDYPLVARAKAGDYDGLEQLVMKHERGMYGLAMRIVQNPADAEEVVQDTFLSVIQHLREFKEQSSFRTWLVRIATNFALKVLRKRRTMKSQPWDSAEVDDNEPLPHPQFIAPWKNEPMQVAQRNEVQQLLAGALGELGEKYRMVFVLRDVEGLSVEETADALDISLSNVKVRLLRARLMLREKLTRFFGDESTRVAPHDHGKEEAGSHP